MKAIYDLWKNTVHLLSFALAPILWHFKSKEYILQFKYRFVNLLKRILYYDNCTTAAIIIIRNFRSLEDDLLQALNPVHKKEEK